MRKPANLSLITFAALVLLLIPLFPGHGSAPLDGRTHESRAAAISDDVNTFINANNVLMFVTNIGVLGRDLRDRFGYDYGTFYPYTSVQSIENGSNTTSPLYASGLWLGGKVNGELRVAVAEYTSEFWPGPMIDGTYDTAALTDSTYRVYKICRSIIGECPYQDSIDWPWEQGAPSDFDHEPVMKGDQMLWCVYNDANPSAHTNGVGGTAPLGIEVQQTVWAADWYEHVNSIYISFELHNKGGNVIDSMYIGFFVDPDLGLGTDDLVGCVPEDNVFFCYNATNNDQRYGTRPPAVGYELINGPIVPSASLRDTAIFDKYRLPRHRNLGLNSVIAYTNGTDPDNAEECYNVLRGLLANGDQYIDPVSGQPDKFMYDGNPNNGTGDLDPDPDDRRLIVSCGPVTMNPGDSQYVLLHLAVARGSSNMNSLFLLKQSFGSTTWIPTDISEGDESYLPTTCALSQNYPNPFNPSTHFNYAIPEKAQVRLEVFNILGRRVAILVDKEQSAGAHEAVWDGIDTKGNPVASGVYFYRLTAGEQSTTRKMMLLK